MITLFQFPPSLGLPNASPFCMRLETYLKLAELEYQVKHMADPRKAPKGKLPMIRDGEELVPDSGFAIAYLEKKHGDKLDGGLDAQQRATAHALTRMLCEHTYFCLLHSRWTDETTWATVKESFRPMFPAVIGGLVLSMVRSGTVKQISSQGVGRHSSAEVVQLAKQDLQTLSTFLGDGPYFFGDEPSTLDASAFAFVANTIWGPNAELSAMGNGFDNLVAHSKRMRERCFPDMEAGR